MYLWLIYDAYFRIPAGRAIALRDTLILHALYFMRVNPILYRQVTLFGRIFGAAASVGATSIAIPAVSAGKRAFPAPVMAAIAAAFAVREMLASGGSLRVLLVGYGAEDHAALFELARQQALLARGFAGQVLALVWLRMPSLQSKTRLHTHRRCGASSPWKRAMRRA